MSKPPPGDPSQGATGGAFPASGAITTGAIPPNGALTPGSRLTGPGSGLTGPGTPTNGTTMAFWRARRAIGGLVANASTPPMARRWAHNERAGAGTGPGTIIGTGADDGTSAILAEHGYAEDRSALTWPLLTTGLYAPVLAIALFIAALAVQAPALYWPAFGFLLVAVTAWIVTSGSFLQYFWPMGIRLNADGLRIGGVRWAEGHRDQSRASKAIVPKQYSQVFSCRWSGVLAIGVTTDRALLKIMKRNAYRGRKLTPLGNLAVPFMRAALVIWVDQAQAKLPAIRPASGPLWYNFPEPGYHQPL